MKVYKKEEFFDWFESQPKNTKVDMGNGSINGIKGRECNCILAQFFQSKGFKKGLAYCDGQLTSEQKLVAEVELDGSIFSYLSSTDGETFGELEVINIENE